MYQLTWIYSPFDEVKGPFVEAWFPLTAEEIAERNPVNLHPPSMSQFIDIRNIGLHQTSSTSDNEGPLERQVTTPGRYYEPYTIDVNYDVHEWPRGYDNDVSPRRQVGCRPVVMHQ